MKKLLPERKKEKPQIIVTNLIDVILLLVFFFMITSTFAQNKTQIQLNVPKAANSSEIEAKPLIVQINKAGEVFVYGKSITNAKLQEVIKDCIKKTPAPQVMVEADKNADYGNVISTLDLIRGAGAFNIGLSTTPKQ